MTLRQFLAVLLAALAAPFVRKKKYPWLISEAELERERKKISDLTLFYRPLRRVNSDDLRRLSMNPATARKILDLFEGGVSASNCHLYIKPWKPS